MVNAQEFKTDVIFSLGFLLAFFSVAGFATSYLYELGYSTYFNIPLQYISVTPTSIALSVTVMAFALFFGVILPSIVLVPILLLIKSSAVRSFFFSLYVPWLVWIVATIFYGITTTRSYLYLLVGLTILNLIWPLLFKKGRTYSQALQFSQEKEIESSKGSLLDVLIQKFGVVTISFIVIVISWGVVAYWAGNGNAKVKTDFLMTRVEGREMIVLSIYGENAILTPYSGNSTVAPVFLVKKVGDLERGVELRKVGLLKGSDVVQ